MQPSTVTAAEKPSSSDIASIRKVSPRTAGLAEEGDALTPAKRSRLEDAPQNALLRSSVVTPAAPSTGYSLAPMQDSEAIRSLLMSEAGYDSSAVSAVPKRSDYISWDDYFMAVAALSAYRSKDPLNPAGACIVDGSNRIIGIGYNGLPTGCSDDCLPWNATEASSDNPDAWLHSQAPYVVHSEVNAVLNKVTPDCLGARLYQMDFPCNECAKLIVQVGIAEVVYVHEGPDNDSTRASRILLRLAGVKLRQYRPVRASVELEFWKHLNETERQEASRVVDQEEVLPSSDSGAVVHRDLLLSEAGYDPATSPSSKRKDAISWDDYFMGMAFLTAQRSKDPNTQVGACIVDTNKRIVGLGYNGFPVGCSDDILPWSRKAKSELHKKYVYVCHAEVNAILNKRGADVRGATLYVALFPCNECSKSIIQAGIRNVVYMSDQYHDTPSCRASRILLKMAGVTLRRHIPVMPSLCICLQSSEIATVTTSSSEEGERSLSQISSDSK